MRSTMLAVVVARYGGSLEVMEPAQSDRARTSPSCPPEVMRESLHGMWTT
jgi:hypothetical protein